MKKDTIQTRKRKPKGSKSSESKQNAANKVDSLQEMHKLQSQMGLMSPDGGASGKNGDASSSGGASPASHHLSPSHSAPNTPTTSNNSQHQLAQLNQSFLGKYTGQRNANAFQYPSSIYQSQTTSTSGHLLHPSTTNVLQSSPITTNSAINAHYNYLEMFNSQQGLGSGETAIVKMEPPTNTRLSYSHLENDAAAEGHAAASRSPSVEHDAGLAINGTNDRPTVVSISG